MKKALLIGIVYVTNPKVSLRGCVNDVINIRNMLIDAYDYEADNITILRDDVMDFMCPTKSNILSQLKLLVDQSGDLEEIWLHYSGHGSQIQNQNSKKRELVEIIIPVNYETEGSIYDFELLEIIKKIKCRAILVFDCCHSGSICDMPWSFDYGDLTELKTVHTNTVIIENSSIYVLSGCRDTESSADSSNVLDQSVGAFTNAIIESLQASHHNISIIDLYKSACIFLYENGYSQNPLLSSSSEHPNYNIKRAQTI